MNRQRHRRHSPKLSRRLILRGAGSIAIALPFFEEFIPKAHARAAELPERLFTLFFGLGIEKEMQNQKFSGPLESLAPFESKAAFFTNVNGSQLTASGTPHFSSAASIFTGVPQNGDGKNWHAGGPSMEQVMKRALHPNGVPNVAVPEQSAGLWSRTGAISQFTRQWNEDGSPGNRPERRPSKVFNRLFGNVEPDDGDSSDPQQVVRNHINRSVLDTVLEQYKRLQSGASPLGAASKARLDNHLAAIRDVEQQLAPNGESGDLPSECSLPLPGDYGDPDGCSFYDAANGATGGGAPIIDWKVAQSIMELHGRLFAIAASCDLLRFGSVNFVGGGGHIRFSGKYEAIGGSVDFGSVLSGGTPHDKLFHDYKQDAVRLYQHFCIRQLSHTLAAMDGIIEANGKSVLDNSLVLMGTEYGKNHDSTDIFHAIVGGGGRFNPGWYDQAILPSDVYHQALAAYDIDSGIPERWDDYQPKEIPGLRT